MTGSAHGPLRFVSTLCAFLALSYLGGCAMLLPQATALKEHWPDDLPQRVELADVPFHAQREYQCGPAALAMALNSVHVPVAPDDLVKQVYLPERQGSLQVEMLAAPRRYGRVSYELAPRFDDVLREVAGGTPVIVLQDYGAWPIKIWHYAVVVGYDRAEGDMILRSGEKERLSMPFPVFEYLWKKSGYWSMVVMPSGHVPATASEQRYLDAVVAMERAAKPGAAQTAYASAVRRWPANLTARIGLANSHYARGDLQLAESELREAQRQHPDSVVVLNNLAQTLSDEGRQEEALVLTDRALGLKSPFAATVRETRDLILERMKSTPARVSR